MQLMARAGFNPGAAVMYHWLMDNSSIASTCKVQVRVCSVPETGTSTYDARIGSCWVKAPLWPIACVNPAPPLLALAAATHSMAGGGVTQSSPGVHSSGRSVAIAEQQRRIIARGMQCICMVMHCINLAEAQGALTELVHCMSLPVHLRAPQHSPYIRTGLELGDHAPRALILAKVLGTGA